MGLMYLSSVELPVEKPSMDQSDHGSSGDGSPELPRPFNRDCGWDVTMRLRTVQSFLLAVTVLAGMPGKVIHVQRKANLGFTERLYLPAIIRALFVTGLHFFRNLRGFV